MTKPEMMHLLREVSVEPFEAAAYSVEAGPAKIPDLWAECVSPDARWLAAARIVPDERGNPVIGELRIFPHERHRPREYDGSGCWGAEVLGTAVRGVPRGGVPGALLRRGIQLTVIRRQARSMVNTLLHIKGLPPDHVISRMVGRLAGSGFTARPRFPKKRSTLGRPRLTDLEYARLASDYVDAFNRSGRPIPELARTRKRAPAAIRSMVARARADGFLSPALMPGTGGGTLTPKTVQVLEGLQRIATGSQTGGKKAPQVPGATVKKPRQTPGRKRRA